MRNQIIYTWLIKLSSKIGVVIIILISDLEYLIKLVTKFFYRSDLSILKKQFEL